ncbi:MAG: hypothetical protein ABF753_03295 [Lentilactobacillus hilgardii]|jgi:hypothetical protein|uniref:hypothetical protein n=1 Tax=Lentilactobacillus hilgardii TaxID=1588 RepID=UPI0039EC2AFD|nr:hypothetical protein [Lentilactobacillus buchneri]
MKDWLIDVGIAILFVLAFIFIIWMVVLFRVFAVCFAILVGLSLFAVLVADVHLFRER